jgi:hypothetical protein
MQVTYRGRLHVVVGVTPMGVQPQLLDLEDVDSGRIRQVSLDEGAIEFANTSGTPEDAAGRDHPL